MIVLWLLLSVLVHANVSDLPELPNDVVKHIMRYSTFRDAHAIAMVSKWGEIKKNPIDRIITNPIQYHALQDDTILNRVVNTAPDITQRILTALFKNQNFNFKAINNQILKKYADHGRWDIIMMIIKHHKFIIDPEIIYLFINSDHDDRIYYLQELLKRVDPSINRNEPFMRAVELGQVDMVQVLIGDPRVDPTDQNMRCITSAAVEGHADILRILFKDKRLNNPPNLLQALRASIPFGKIQIIELVLSYPSYHRNIRDLERAAYHDQPLVFKILLDDALKFSFRFELLHQAIRSSFNIACVQDYDQILDVILNHETRLIRPDDLHRGLLTACEIGHSKVLKRILQTPDVNAGVSNNILFMTAVENGHLNVIQELMNKTSINPSEADNALEIACDFGYIDIVHFFLFGDNSTLFNPAADGNYPIRIASYRGHSEIVSMLLQSLMVDDYNKRGYESISTELDAS